ncbi:MAG TPA: BACON domain-containing carbohydrate-binding protein [Vicinamibacterales bacterium]|nr:BACON domain-containing carbohydrate-binding protein [Vicinamibacterales bacterium]
MYKAVTARPLTSLLLSVLSCVLGACGSTVATSTGPSPTKCAVALAVPASPVSSNGDTTTVGVTTQPECAWSASSDAAWITGLTPASGQGSAQLQMQIAANPAGTARQGDIIVNGERGRIRQDAVACVFELSTTEQTVPAAGGTGRITVTTAAGCAWSAQADAAWVTLNGGSTGTGTGNLTFTIGSNSGTTTRAASIVVAGQTVKITQQTNAATPPPPVLPVNCSVTVTPKDVSLLATGTGSSSISVSAAAACEWSASTDTSWISLTGRTSGTGNGTVTFSVASNIGAARSGDLTIADQTVSVHQAAGTVPCSYTVTPLTTSVTKTGGTGSPITIDTQTGCAWTAASNATWLVITSATSGSGDASVSFRASENMDTTAGRSGTLTVAGQTVTVSQPSAACPYTLSPTTISIPAAGSTATSVSVTTAGGCPWNGSSNASWISIVSGASGSASGTMTIAVGANSGAARSGTLTIAGQTVTVNQAAAPCSYSVAPTTLSVGAGGGATGPVTVTATAGCTWTATSNVSWLSITAGASGTGNGGVSITAVANTGAARTGTLTIASQTVTVNQAATTCSYSVTPTTVSIGAAGGTGMPISVSVGSGCTWAATSSAAWVTILTGATGTGNGSVTYSVQANTGSARTGTLTVAGQGVTISQSAPCTYNISPMSTSFDKAGGTGTVSVTTQTGCAWTAVSTATWITISGGSSGTGNGTVNFAVAANATGSDRTGTLTIAGRTFTVTEKH